MASDPNCIFCKIVAGTIPCFKLFEDGARRSPSWTSTRSMTGIAW